MVRLPFRRFSNLIDWGKLILPQHQIRYFPPRFIVRDPIVEGVSRAFKKGYEVAVIVYNINNLTDLNHSVGNQRMEEIIHRIKNVFRRVIKHDFHKADVILLDYYYSEGFTLYIRVDDEATSVYDIDSLMKHISTEIKTALLLEKLTVQPVFDEGYMFIDKKYCTLKESIYRAQQQALAMAEKRVQTEYNEMLYEMSKIVARKAIRLFGQPIIDMNTKEIRAWEILTRGPKGTNLEMPLRLFSVARQTGHLYDLEMIVLEKTFEKIEETGCKQEIFVNCTPLSLGNKRFFQDIKQLLVKFKMIDPQKLIIEMTEQDTVDVKTDLIENVKVMRALGFRFALDDTGSGYSSFHSIGELLPEIIKVDRDVIQNIHENSVNESMLKGILLVAKEVGSRVIAEGIENEEEAELLSQHAVDYAQGYFFAKPAVFDDQLLSSIR